MSDGKTFRIERLNAAGFGVAAAPDQGVVVPGALPGEAVELSFSGDKPTLERVAEASPHRVPAPCPHAAGCGGCALQHAEPGFLAGWKRERVIAALARFGLSPEVSPTMSSPLHSRRRVKLTARRGKKGVQLGFLGARSHVVAPIEKCMVMRPEIEAALPALRRLTLLTAPRSRSIALWVETSESGLDVALEGAKEPDTALTEAVMRWAEEEDVARLTWNDEPFCTRRPPFRRYGKALVSPPPGAFAQATAEGEAALVAWAGEALADCRRVGDLFAGAGAFALSLAARAEVLAVEGDAGLLAALERGWRETGGRLKAVKAVRRDLFRRPLTPDEMKGLEGLVFDPPRAGAEAQAVHLAQAPPSVGRLVGVSCNPASFARDAAILSEGGWRLSRVAPVDQFLFTPHIELIGLFER